VAIKGAGLGRSVPELKSATDWVAVEICAAFALKELFAAVGLRNAALPATQQSHSSLRR
jgi:hypothetical protein